MKELEITSLFWQLKSIVQPLSLLNFWKDYPEIKSISVSCNYTYDDAGAYFPSFSVTNIEFVSPDAKKCLAQQLFPNRAVNNSESEIEDYEWNEAISFTENVILAPEDDTYVRPDDLDTQITNLQRQANSQIFNYIKERELYAVIEPLWEYNDEYYYTSGSRTVDIYLDKNKAENAAKQINLATVKSYSSEEINCDGHLFEDKDPDNCETTEEKLALWEKYASEFLAWVELVKLK